MSWCTWSVSTDSSWMDWMDALRSFCRAAASHAAPVSTDCICIVMFTLHFKIIMQCIRVKTGQLFSARSLTSSFPSVLLSRCSEVQSFLLFLLSVPFILMNGGWVILYNSNVSMNPVVSAFRWWNRSCSDTWWANLSSTLVHKHRINGESWFDTVAFVLIYRP